MTLATANKLCPHINNQRHDKSSRESTQYYNPISEPSVTKMVEMSHRSIIALSVKMLYSL